MLWALTFGMINQLTNEVASVCGNNESKMIEFASSLGLEHGNNWWQAAYSVAKHCGSIAEIHRLAYAD